MRWRQINAVLLCGILGFAPLFAPCVHAQSSDKLSPEELEILENVLAEVQEQNSVPHGTVFNMIPVLGYNTDLGFCLGAAINLEDYGRSPSLFPDTRHKFSLEVTYFTKGQGRIRADYASGHLIPGVKFSASLIYQDNPLHQFYGFGGDITDYDRGKDRRNDLSYYSFNRKMGSLQTFFRGPVTGHLDWTAGLSAWYFDTSDTAFRNYDGTNSLYHFYRASGIIGDDETKGGIMELRAGLCWDSRDYEMSPSRGIYADVGLSFSPDIFATGYSYAKLAAHFRHYITPGPDWLTFAYHLAYQGTIAGKAPFYIQQHIYSNDYRQSLEEGLGGFGTLRGVLSGRLIGDGYAWGNIEARIRIAQFTILGLDSYLALNPFYDLGAIVQPYKIDEISKATGVSREKLLEKSSRLHQSAGLGLKFGIDRNYLISFEIARAFNTNDGPTGFTTAINYIF